MDRDKLITYLVLVFALCSWGLDQTGAQAQTIEQSSQFGVPAPIMKKMLKVTPAQRKAAAERAAARRAATAPQGVQSAQRVMAMPMPGGTPDYFNMPNWTNSPLLRKFVDTLPGLGPTNANNLGQYIPIANPDTLTYPGSDYYEIGLIEYRERMHSDLPATKLRGYIQLNNGTNPATHKNTVAPAPVHYLGPLILAQRNRPVRVKFTNMLPTGSAGDLFIPVDTTTMGAGMGPLGMNPPKGSMNYTQNRATLHLHGGHTPWISDGTPHQWITPAGEDTSYPKGVSVSNVPDMPDPGDGSQTFFYTNQQSARLMFYHDHAYGITRLNVYAGEAAGYMITETAEQALVNSGAIPAEQIPLIIQDKTFVPDDVKLASTDSTWDTTKWGMMGDLWFPHVYMPNQNPADSAGVNALGRWDYGPWFWPPVTTAAGLKNGTVTLPDGTEAPGTPDVSMVMEAFMDTPLVNGTAYPFLPVQRKAYRFRILNACNDRFLNLQVYYARSNTPDAVDPVTGLPTLQTNSGEITMVPLNPGVWPAGWPTPDGRDGGVPDPNTAGPAIVQIGTEGGFLPKPVVLPNIPIGYDMDRRSITVLNVKEHTLFLGPAERADVIIDFSQVPAGSKLILYNDSPAPVPATDPRVDYYTGNPDLTAVGGAPSTVPGYGPNTRTIMQFQVAGNPAVPFVKGPTNSYDTAMLNALNTALPATFAATQPPPIVPQAAYGPAYGTTFTNTYSRIQSTSLTFTPIGAFTPMTLSMQPKAIQELFELEYGRMNSTLGVELPLMNILNQTTIPFGYIDPPTEIINASPIAGPPVAGDGTQLWKITHNGVDTHAIHFHLFDVQLVNRVDWAGVVKPPEDNELGWKDTVRMNPLEDAIVAMRPTAPELPFGIPNSVRLLDPTMPLGSTTGFTNVDPATGKHVTVTNEMTNFGWEYVWHCHLLGHEEMDMMRPVVFNVPQLSPKEPTNLNAIAANVLTWTDPTPASSAMGNPSNEIGFRIERATYNGAFVPIGTALANATTFTDTTKQPLTTYSYRVFAYNVMGDSPASNIVILPRAPGTPSINTVTAGNTQVTVNFTAPAFDGGSPITSYTVTASPSGKTATGVASPITVTGLTNGTAYTFTVTATNAIGTGQPSNPSNSITPAMVTLTANLASPQAMNTSITLTATSIDIVRPEYQFRVGYQPTPTTWSWSVLRNYSTTRTCTWTPTTPREYTLVVWVREQGSTAAYQVYTTLTYRITTPITAVTLAAAPLTPQKVNTPIKMTASVTGGWQVEYQYRVGYQDAQGWHWSASAYTRATSYTWTPTVARLYTLVVYAREVGRTAAYDKFTTLTYRVTLN